MIWLYLLLAIVAFVIALKTTSMVVVILCLLAALGFLIAWVLGLLAQRIGNQSRDVEIMLDPQALRRLREQAEARSQTAGVPPVSQHDSPQP
ncbi:hypothetical protein [Luteimonas panaciterrae]|uniref:hypothetical protein n=1 Tax=Luteimonas panaciterrae TaxID=363885 RepID=UPI001CFB0F02|nr:hypothetical protein [Luteimonas panaciterrae]